MLAELNSNKEGITEGTVDLYRSLIILKVLVRSPALVDKHLEDTLNPGDLHVKTNLSTTVGRNSCFSSIENEIGLTDLSEKKEKLADKDVAKKTERLNIIHLLDICH